MMGLFKGNKNARKKEKRESLSVKKRGNEERARKVRFVASLFGFSLSLFLLILLGWKGVDFVMQEAVYKNPRLAIERIDIETDGVLSPEKIREWARIKPGDNLLALDLSRLKRDLELHPLIESAAAEKILPRQLRISITERKPLAVVYLYYSGKTQIQNGLDRVYIDAAGMVIPPLQSSERNSAAEPIASSLPALTGFDPRELRPGAFVESPHIRAALELIAQFDRSPVASMLEFRSIDLSSPNTLVARVDPETEITFAADNFARQLARLQTTLGYARDHNRALATLDLAVGNYVPVRWIEPSTNSPSATTPIILQNSRNRKKHV
ncbi:MAG TPA: FtsQ-type POTRA domain-containing protein [Verrucomicrobiae bacterium]|nr:FtsQ-type POTRA domain-containing protein [Verrucomicrobiae bacterium]